jgi:hypothetical protein
MQSQDRPMTLAEQMALAKNVIVILSKISIPFVRKNVGFRLLNPLHVFGIALSLFVLGTLSVNTPNHESLIVFSVLFLIFGIGQRLRRWVEFNQGECQHSYYLGDSIFEFRWFPKFLTTSRRVPRFIDPLICIACGFMLRSLCEPLGAIVIFSGLSLRYLEAEVHKRDQSRDMDLMDGIIVAHHQNRTVEKYASPKTASDSKQQAAGIPTGLGDDIERKIRERNARN